MRALAPDTMLVTGIRGAGKSFWWYLLQNQAIRDEVVGRDISVSVGFGQGSDASWPDRDELQQLLGIGLKPRLIWKAVVLRQIVPNLVPAGDWRQLVEWVVKNPSQVATSLREFDEKLERDKQTHIVLFDALDRTADTRAEQEQLLYGLLQLVLEFRAYRALRAKVFARPDMLDAPEVVNFADASKVLASGTNLEWRTVDLYGLLFQYLGNANDAEAASLFQRLAIKYSAVAGRVEAPFWLVPKLLRSDEERQRKVFEAIAGPYMGTNERRGRTYTWVPNHLADALNKVSPRSFLAAIRQAATAPSKHDFALHWSGLQEGVRRASSIRAAEIQEDLPWAHGAMEQLKDLAVPCPREKVISAWKKGGLLSKDLRGLPSDLEGIMGELGRTGIIKELTDGRINIPDVYRLGFGLRRKGGFAPKR